MNIRFVLRDSPGKGSKYKIRCYIQHNGRAYYNTKYSVLEKEWDPKNNRVRENRPNAFEYNSFLIKLRNEIEGLCLRHPSVSAREIVRMIGGKGVDSFLSFFDQFIKDCETGKNLRALSTVKKYREILSALKGFEKRTDFDTIGLQWYNDYTGHLRTKGNSENTIGNHIKIIKAIMRQAFDLGISKNVEFQKKFFKKPSEETDSIYLTEGEIELWSNCDLSSYDYLQMERDRFLISYYFLLRFGDSLRFNKTNFYKEKKNIFYRQRAEKTLIETIIPVKPIAYEILKKYDFQFPSTTNQEANWKLKEIGGIAKIENPTTIGGLTRPKHKFITNHTARRSGATNLYLQGVPDKVIMDLGGWRKLETFRSYIRITRIESAKKALDFAFFK